jgi:hypothetical protein
MSLHTEQRYIKNNVKSSFVTWRFSWPCTNIPKGKNLRIEVQAEATIRWSTDKWKTTQNTDTYDTKLGIHVADIDLHNVETDKIYFTFFWKKANHWENHNFNVPVSEG